MIVRRRSPDGRPGLGLLGLEKIGGERRQAAACHRLVLAPGSCRDKEHRVRMPSAPPRPDRGQPPARHRWVRARPSRPLLQGSLAITAGNQQPATHAAADCPVYAEYDPGFPITPHTRRPELPARPSSDVVRSTDVEAELLSFHADIHVGLSKSPGLYSRYSHFLRFSSRTSRRMLDANRASTHI